MSHEVIAILMFSSMMLMLLTGQRVFGAIGFVAVVAAFFLWGDRGGFDIGFSAAIKLMKWYPLLTLPMFIFMGYVLSESKIADDLYRMFHVWMGGLSGGLAVGTIGLMVLISAMNGLSVAGMAIGNIDHVARLAVCRSPAKASRDYDHGRTIDLLDPRDHEPDLTRGQRLPLDALGGENTHARH